MEDERGVSELPGFSKTFSKTFSISARDASSYGVPSSHSASDACCAGMARRKDTPGFPLAFRAFCAVMSPPSALYPRDHAACRMVPPPQHGSRTGAARARARPELAVAVAVEHAGREHGVHGDGGDGRLCPRAVVIGLARPVRFGVEARRCAVHSPKTYPAEVSAAAEPERLARAALESGSLGFLNRA